ncbi:MAG: AI-2E family transporter [Chloroflexi bacterium]|nr:AI-2E family transporter [Chloroflexota bacterium]
MVVLILLGLAFLAINRVSLLIMPLAIATILAYLIDPVVRMMTRRTPLSRKVSIALIYLLMIAALVSIPVSAITPLIVEAISFIQNTPSYLAQLGEFFQEPIILTGGIEIPVDQLSLDQAFRSLSDNLVQVVQTVGGQTLTIFSKITTATISTVGWTFMVLFLSFYLVKDHKIFFNAILELTPANYRDDVRLLANEISFTWHAFLRGQLVLCVVVGIIIFVIALIIGLPNPLLLAIIAGIMELVPTFGPILAAVPAVMIALIQFDLSWAGALMGPFWFGLMVLIIYGVVYQFENYYLVPRIIGHHLKLHPLIIVVGVLAGASVAGVVGILLAAPVMATARLILRYIYRKLTDKPPFPDSGAAVVDEETAVSPPPSNPSNIGTIQGSGST